MNGETENLCQKALDKSAVIAQRNDDLRKTVQGGVILVTRGVRAIVGFMPFELLALLATYAGFDGDNDPYGEHDFGDIDYHGHELLWKIDYYAEDMVHGSPDPSDPTVTARVLTVMLACEY